MKNKPTTKKMITMTIISFVILLATYIFMIDIYINVIYGPNRNQDGMNYFGVILILMIIPIGGFVFWNIGLNFSYVINSIIDLRKAIMNNNSKNASLVLLIANSFLFLSDVGFLLMLSYNKVLFG